LWSQIFLKLLIIIGYPLTLIFSRADVFQFFYSILSRSVQNHFLSLNKKGMKKSLSLIVTLVAISTAYGNAQDIKASQVPAVVKSTFAKKYPEAQKVSWEKEKGNYEANWGGKSGEDNSAAFTPSGDFVEIVKAIPISDLPKAVAPYVKAHYNGAKIKEAGRVTDAAGKTMYEAEIKGGDLIFDENGNFIKKD
jgi:hypothetical protein